ncbi:HEAT repeat domain-containing protein [Oxalobacteraceae bacterium A2-2]
MPLTKTTTAAAPGQDSPDAMLAALEHADPEQRRRAALALAAHPSASVALLARVPLESDQAARQALLTALATIGNAQAVDGMAGFLSGEDVWLRNAAIDALRQLPDQVAPLMGQLLTHPDRDVRIMAIGVLDTLRHPHVERWLLHVIAADTDLNVCGAALDLLAEVATGDAIAPVRALLARFPDQDYLRFAGELTLRRAAGG